MTSVALVSAGHCVGGWNFHLQFTPAYRRPVFQDAEVKRVCQSEAQSIAARLGVELAASEFGPNHWHLFVTGAKNYSAPQLARRFKGATSHAIRSSCAERVRKWLWGDHFWSHGYFAETVGRVTSETVKFYIERQQRKHWIKPQRDVSVQTQLSA